LSLAKARADAQYMPRRMKNVAYRLLLVTACAGVLLVNSGCVYWRLNQFRNQMSAFPDYYRIDERDLPTIVALEPVLKPDDLGWLTGLPASETVVTGRLATETYHFVKYYTDPADDEQGAYDIILLAHFNKDGRLHEFQAPARFAVMLTEENFDEVFRPMKDGTIERLQHATGWAWEEHKVNIPVREEIIDFLGVPYDVEEAEEGMAYTYAYQLKGNEVRWNPKEWDMYVRLLFEPEEERVVHSESYMGRLRVTVDLRSTTNVVKIKRL